MAVPGRGAAKRLVLETFGWILLLAGVAAIFLPGPGLLGIFAGLALLSQQYDWAERRVEPVRIRALRGAAEGVETWPRIVASVLGALVLVACGVLWIQRPDAPGWWPLAETWWLPGGPVDRDHPDRLRRHRGRVSSSTATGASTASPRRSPRCARRAIPTRRRPWVRVPRHRASGRLAQW